jgi:hypothetical protein
LRPAPGVGFAGGALEYVLPEAGVLVAGFLLLDERVCGLLVGGEAGLLAGGVEL